MIAYKETEDFYKFLGTIPFDANLIDFLVFYNHSTCAISKCEHWGWDDEGENGFPFSDFGIISDFDFSIYKDKMVLFYGWPLDVGFYSASKDKLIILPRGCNVPDEFIMTGSFDLHAEYKPPKTMLDVVTSVHDFLEMIAKERERLKQVHKIIFT